jgi:hypothetical protein
MLISGCDRLILDSIGREGFLAGDAPPVITKPAPDGQGRDGFTQHGDTHAGLPVVVAVGEHERERG